MEKKKSELTVITKAKDLCSYVMAVTQKSPKQFRFTFVSRLQNLTLSVIENLFRANDVFVVKGDLLSQKERISFQQSALTDFEKLYDFQNLYKAHTVARRGKRATREVIEFEMNLSDNLATLSDSLKNGTKCRTITVFA